jgi:hypothetical protein
MPSFFMENDFGPFFNRSTQEEVQPDFVPKGWTGTLSGPRSDQTCSWRLSQTLPPWTKPALTLDLLNLTIRHRSGISRNFILGARVVELPGRAMYLLHKFADVKKLSHPIMFEPKFEYRVSD